MCEVVPHDWLFYVDGDCCMSDDEPFELADWVGSMCNKTEWREQFTYYDGMAQEDWQEWIEPWNWTVQTRNTSADIQKPSDRVTCQAPSRFLGLFFLDNASSVLSTIIMTFMKSTLVAKRDKNRLFKFLASQVKPPHWFKSVFWGTVTAAVQIGLNFANAARVQQYSGFHHVPTVRLGLLYCSRPSLNWFPVVVAFFPPSFLQSHKERAIWADVGYTAAVCELLMQAFGSVTFGMTADLGRQRLFYIPKYLYPFWRGKPAVHMYVGALFWLMGCIIIIPFWLIVAFLLGSILKFAHHAGAAAETVQKTLKEYVWEYVWTKPSTYIWTRPAFQKARTDLMATKAGLWMSKNIFTPVSNTWNKRKVKPEKPTQTWFSRNIVNGRFTPWGAIRNLREKWDQEQVIPDGAPDSGPWLEEAPMTMFFAGLLGLVDYVSQWLFWDGFVKSQGSRYCPPNNELPKIFTIWVFSSIAAIVITFMGVYLF
ncbi:hypothetical protein B0J14DRAFT_636039 [Halenospora varia]|nr:hypothetical protein B0J14DRAFT_636039 [Halenospora varia]